MAAATVGVSRLFVSPVSRSWRAGLVLVAALVLSVVAAAQPAPARAIANGTLDGTDHPAVGLMLIGGGLCSGVLVHSSQYGEVFLTAAHCSLGVNPWSEQPAEGAPVEVSFEPSWPASWHQGTFWADPQWTGNTSFNLLTDSHDSAVVVFDPGQKPHALKPLPIAPLGAVDSLPPGSQLTAVGYGVTSGNGYDVGVRREGTVSLGDVSPFENIYPYEIVTTPDPSDTCEGDSGGPELATIDGTAYIVATTTWGASRYCEDPSSDPFSGDHRVDTTEVQTMVNAAYPGGPT